MSQIRPFRKSDISAVCALRQKVFRETRHKAPGSLEQYYAELFFDGPLSDSDFPSFLAESDSGQVIGFIGVICRMMSLKGQPVRMAVATELMVDPDHRGFAALELLRRHFAGPQDLTFSDVANSKARVIWEGLRGESGLLYSLEWSRPLRPWRHAANQLTTGTAGRVARGAFRPFFRLADNRLVRREHATFKIQRPSETRVRPLDPAAMEHELARLCAKRSLRPHYPAHLSSWLMQQLRKKGLGSLRCMVTEDLDGRCLGWFIYFSNPGGTGQVVQVISSTAHISLLLDAMFFDAWEEGVVELSGRADPASLAEYSAKGCRFYTTPTSVLVHSRNPEVLKSIRLGQALLTRLEGEWWMNP